MSVTPQQRSELARAAVLTRWARTVNRSAATQAARDGLYRRYLPVNFDQIADPGTRAKLLESARKAHAAKMRAAKAAKRAAE